MRTGTEFNVSRIRWFDKRGGNRSECAGQEEFVSLFEAERTTLQRLALLLTANSEAAERSLALALRECIAIGSVSKDWVLAWARRVVIRNAISVVMEPGEQSLAGLNGNGERGPVMISGDSSLVPFADSQQILALPDLDRLVFVICILERHSIHDCALLLGKSPRDINQTRQRIANQLVQIDESRFTTFW